ncbi:hypothetical protein B0H19DRAFT_525600 [Mycena capillaripes]|nr:hypothetical protein B0H19DRAFT_525600 [Mycena capillaripes]
MFSDYKATPRLLDVSRAQNLTHHPRYIAPDAVPRQHQTLAHPRYDTAARGARCVPYPSQTPLSSPPAPDDHLQCSPTLSLDAYPSRPAPTTICTITRVRRAPPAPAAPAAAVPYRPVALFAVRHTTTVFSRIPPPPLGAWAHSRQDDYHRRAQRPPRPFFLVRAPLVASALAVASAAPSHSKPASVTQQKRDAQPQRRLQHLHRRLRRLFAHCDIPRGILTPVLPASACRAPPIRRTIPAACAPQATVVPHPPAPRPSPHRALRRFSPL